MHAEPDEENEHYLHLDSSGKCPREVCALDVIVFFFFKQNAHFKMNLQ